MSDEKKPVRELKRAHMQQAEYARNAYVIMPEAGVTKEDLLEPQYWAHTALILKPFDMIEVYYRHDDKTYYARLIVLSSLRTQAKVELLDYKELEVIKEQDFNLGDFYVKYGNMHLGYRVHRHSDKKAIKEGFKSKAEAIKWLADNQQSLAA